MSVETNILIRPMNLNKSRCIPALDQVYNARLTCNHQVMEPIKSPIRGKKQNFPKTPQMAIFETKLVL